MIRPIIKFIIMFIGIGVSGLILGFSGALVGIQILERELFGFGELAGALGGMIIGYPLGVIVGLILINKILHQRGSLLLGILGIILRLLITVALSLLNL